MSIVRKMVKIDHGNPGSTNEREVNMCCLKWVRYAGLSCFGSIF
jgi:hypothetical protein